MNIVQRLVNRVGRPFGVLPFAQPYQRPYARKGQRQAVFERIAAENAWNSAESISGTGSEMARTANYRADLVKLLKELGTKRFFDAPCGDLNWMGAVLKEVPLDYLGGDISAAVVAKAKERHPELDLFLFDICKDTFPSADIWQCRDTMLHLSFEDIWSALENFTRSGIPLALISTSRGRWLKNMDITTGGHRPTDLMRPPFNLPKPMRFLRDTAFGEFPRAVGVWDAGTIRAAVERRPR